MNMIIRSVDLVMSAGFMSQCPPDSMPEIALVGRSNVGKSTLINTMLQRKRLARTSASPGKTQTLNFYRINERFHLVDLPGYGYAALGKGKQEQISQLLQDYLIKRPQLRLVVQLVDSRHEPSQLDKEMTAFLQHFNRPFMVVGTKRDKLTRSQWQRAASVLRKELILDVPPLLFCAGEEASREALWEQLVLRVPELKEPEEVE